MDGKRTRGRPRPDETIKRDDSIETLLNERGPLTRNQVAEELNLTPTLAYLALDRLRRQRRVRKCAGTGSSTVWSSAAEEPCP